MIEESPSFLLIGLTAKSRERVEMAAALAFPAWRAVDFHGIDEAFEHPPGDDFAILIMEATDPEEVHKAVCAKDAAGLSRWPVVVLGVGAADSGAVSLTRARDDPEALANAIEFAILHHQLRRDHERAIGDLRTVGQRISHDLRSPMGCIRITAEMIGESIGDGISAPSLFTRPIIDSADEMLALLDRVSLILKASANPAPCDVVDMGEVFHRAHSAAECRLAEAGAIIERPRHWPAVRGVPGHLEAVWGNLLMSAVEHGGKAPRLEAGWQRRNGDVHFWIRDDGPGVPENLRGDLFRPFNLLHEGHRAHGLGLSIVQRLVELNGGRCGYESEAAGGSRFWFSLPDRSEADPNAPDEGAAGAGARFAAKAGSEIQTGIAR